MISLKDVTFTFQGSESPALRRVNLDFKSGEFALVTGPTGSGKSTLLRLMIGLAPHFTGGRLSGSIHVDGRNLAGRQPHDFASLVGYVNQQPEGSFVSDTVREELAFGMEQLGILPETMAARIDYVAKVLELEPLLDSQLETLSGGEQQRVAIGAAIAGGQQILILDEPTSALDTHSAAALIALLRRLSNQGLTVILAEHRVERLLHAVDSLTVVHVDGTVSKRAATAGYDELLRDNRMVPPVVELGQKLGWEPLPLSVAAAAEKWQDSPAQTKARERADGGQTLLTAKGVSVNYGNLLAVDQASVSVRASMVQAIVGPNGSGKSSLLWALAGQQKHSGSVALADGTDPATLKPATRLAHLAMVPQNASDLLMLASIGAELADSDAFAEAPSGTTARIFAALAGRIDPARHPRDLSSGQQLAMVIAIQLAKGAPILLLDEPTRGLDYVAKHHLVEQLDMLRQGGTGILIASHDVEFLAQIADECALISHGHLGASTDAGVGLSSLAEHSPQVWQVTRAVTTLAEVSA